MRRRAVRRARRDRGAVAVEFALLFPLLLLLIFGIIDFGRAINAQITLTQAARTGARLASVGAANVSTATQSAAVGLSPVSVTVSDCPAGTTSGSGCTTVTTCPANAGTSASAVVQASYSFSFVTPLKAIAGLFGGSSIGSSMTLTATGVMPCET